MGVVGKCGARTKAVVHPFDCYSTPTYGVLYYCFTKCESVHTTASEYFFLQGMHVLFLAVYTTVHGYLQPYRALLANLLEIAVNVNFLLLLLISTTHYFYDDLFIFPTHNENTECASSLNSIAQVSWILMPVYYLPVLGACVTVTVLTIVFFRYVRQQVYMTVAHFCLSTDTHTLVATFSAL